EPRKEREQAVDLADATDVQLREVKLPFEKTHEVVAEGEGARRPEEPPAKAREIRADLVDARPDRVPEIQYDRDQHHDHDPADVDRLLLHLRRNHPRIRAGPMRSTRNPR